MQIITPSFFKGGKIIVHPKRMAILKAKKEMEGALVVIRSPAELTLVIPEENVVDSDVLEIYPGWHWLTFDMDIPLDTVGFFAPITKALADAEIGVDIYSAFSTDHLLIREKDLVSATRVLEGLGFKVLKK